MSGLTAEEARSKLELIYKRKARKKDIMLKYEEYETNINSELLDINYNIEEAVREAISFGKEKIYLQTIMIFYLHYLDLKISK